jgi:hypothetical protein
VCKFCQLRKIHLRLVCVTKWPFLARTAQYLVDEAAYAAQSCAAWGRGPLIAAPRCTNFLALGPIDPILTTEHISAQFQYKF